MSGKGFGGGGGGEGGKVRVSEVRGREEELYTDPNRVVPSQHLEVKGHDQVRTPVQCGGIGGW